MGGETMSNPIDRRGFLATLLAAGTGLLVRSVKAAEQPDKPKDRLVAVSLGSLDGIREKGSGMLAEIQGETLLLIRTEEQKIAAFSPLCTHEKCVVEFDREARQIECNCHRSSFDLAGKPVGGPAKEPLRQFPAAIKGDKLIIKLPTDPVLPPKSQKN